MPKIQRHRNLSRLVPSGTSTPKQSSSFSIHMSLKVFNWWPTGVDSFSHQLLSRLGLRAVEVKMEIHLKFHFPAVLVSRSKFAMITMST